MRRMPSRKGISVLTPDEMDAKIAAEVVAEAEAMKDLDPASVIDAGRRHFGETVEAKDAD